MTINSVASIIAVVATARGARGSWPWYLLVVSRLVVSGVSVPALWIAVVADIVRRSSLTLRLVGVAGALADGRVDRRIGLRLSAAEGDQCYYGNGTQMKIVFGDHREGPLGLVRSSIILVAPQRVRPIVPPCELRQQPRQDDRTMP